MMSRKDTREVAARHPWWAGVRPLARIVLAPLASLLILGSPAWSQTHIVTTVTDSTSHPVAVASDAAGVRYVAEFAGHRILKVAPDGTTTLLADVSGGFYGIAVAPSGTVYASNIGAHRILEIDSNGNITTLAGGTRGYADGTGASAQFYYPSGLALDAGGNLYVADRDNHRIRRIDTTTGEVTTVAGSSLGYLDAQGTAARFNTPVAVAVDLSGTLYVADTGNTRIRKIAPDGTVTTLAGSTQGYADGTGAAAQFATPWGIAVDAAGWIYVGDSGNNSGDYYSIGAGNQHVRVVSPAGVVTTLAGTATAGFLDGPAGTAQFQSPRGLTVSASGVVWVTDEGNNRLREIAATAPAPTASAVTPALGNAVGGIAVTITGSGFVAGATIAVDGVPAADVTVVDDATITCTLPAHAAGVATLAVRNPDGQIATVPGGFTYRVFHDAFM